MNFALRTLLGFVALAATVHGAEFHVATNGSDTNPGTLESPFRTIQHAAGLAQPGDVITVHQGIYRERIDPPRGGLSAALPIVYQAAPGETVKITGSEIVTNWVRVRDHVWKATIPNSFFGRFNPFADRLQGDWFDGFGRPHHTGVVYHNGDWLAEAATLADVFKPVGRLALWFGQVDLQKTTLWAQFKTANPNDQSVEVNVRQTVFYPAKTGINYITVRGFTLTDAATPWAPPTAEQIGLIGPHWSRGWVIESNNISYSLCSGISLGKYGDQWDNTSSNSATGYVLTIQRAVTNGWSAENIGHHIIRGNTISHCEQAGIIGSLGAAFSTITGNTIHNINDRHWFGGLEQAAIKFHGAVDVTISHNHIYQCGRGVWLDWMAQGARVTGNLFHDNGLDAFIEADQGPYLIDNNLFLSPASLINRSHGGAYAHNLFAGTFGSHNFETRLTPYFKAHSLAIAGYHANPAGDDRYYNNLFVKHADLRKTDNALLPSWWAGNVFLAGAIPSKFEKAPLVETNFDPALKLSQNASGFQLALTLDSSVAGDQTRPLVTTELLGRAAIPNLPYENPDGSPLRLITDYFGRPRNETNPAPGPFELSPTGRTSLKVW